MIKDKLNGIFEGIGCSIITIIFIVFIFSSIGFIICGLFANNYEEEQYTTQIELVALNDFTGQESSISGGFFLCVGGFNGSSSDTYNIRYASKDSNNVIKINTMKVDSNKVGFIEDGNAKVVIKYNTNRCKRSGRIGEWLFGKCNYTYGDSIIGYEFHVPKGSITNDIKVDLK